MYSFFFQLQAIVTDASSEAIMRLYNRTNTTANLVDDLYSVNQQNVEATYQHDVESYADGNRLFRICSVRKSRHDFV